MCRKLIHLILSSLLFLSVFANLQANTLQNNKINTATQNNLELALTNTSQNLNIVFSPIENEPKSSFNFNFVDVSDLEENEEKLSSKEVSLKFSRHILTSFYSHVSETTAKKENVNTFTYHHNFSNKSLRLHAKYQVFII